MPKTKTRSRRAWALAAGGAAAALAYVADRWKGGKALNALRERAGALRERDGGGEPAAPPSSEPSPGATAPPAGAPEEKPPTGFPEPPGRDPGDRSRDPSPHHALNTPVGEPDPTEWPDPYEQREDPRDPPDPDGAPFGEQPHPQTGSASTSDPHPSQDPEAVGWEGPKREKLDD